MKYKVTLISDTHCKHKQLSDDLPGGDILIHAGDISSMGYKHEIQNFCKWFNNLSQYTTKIFIAGNHDWGFQDNSEEIAEVVKFYKNITYLQDDLYCIGDDYASMIKIWGSPWQPEFYNWAFNLPRNSPEMWEKWLMIPENTDILITHGPAHGVLDRVIGGWENLGCEMLAQRIKDVKPKIHVCGHIHSAYGYQFVDGTHYFNAAVLGEDYRYHNKPISFIWDKDTNEIEFV
jgi:Icc-related predicted phosphoesterase